MVRYILDNGTMVKDMETEYKFKKMVKYMKDIGLKIIVMVKVGTFITMEISNS